MRSAGAAEEWSPADQVEAAEAELFLRAQELQEANRRLRRARRRERQATAAARAALRRQQQVVADTSHDLRRPLTGLQTRLQVALTDPQADSRQVLHAALQDAERLGDIVSDLLELARLEGNAPFPTEPVDLSALVAAELARSDLACATTVDITAGIVVEGSAVRLARVLSNLLSNADRHATSLVQVKVFQRDEQAFVEVADDGPGIPANEREAVFQRFYRRADARSSDPEGTGLGLPIARQIARAHHGDLDIADRPGGTCMILRLPCTPP
nr:HAMP domain-containing sensor histidine kinase [Actinomadura citrea]